jgi:hypothetical protein
VKLKGGIISQKFGRIKLFTEFIKEKIIHEAQELLY